jgi:hypothetical protein
MPSSPLYLLVRGGGAMVSSYNSLLAFGGHCELRRGARARGGGAFMNIDNPKREPMGSHGLRLTRCGYGMGVQRARGR